MVFTAVAAVLRPVRRRRGRVGPCDRRGSIELGIGYRRGRRREYQTKANGGGAPVIIVAVPAIPAPIVVPIVAVTVSLPTPTVMVVLEPDKGGSSNCERRCSGKGEAGCKRGGDHGRQSFRFVHNLSPKVETHRHFAVVNGIARLIRL